MNTQMIKQQRISDVNAVIRAIARHGRRFFYNVQFDRTARIVTGQGGHLFFVDDYTDKAIRIDAGREEWRGFSHGGTLRNLVECFGAYIRTGETLALYMIGLKRDRTDKDSYIWGYTHEAIEAVKAEIKDSPVFEKEEPCPAH